MSEGPCLTSTKSPRTETSTCTHHPEYRIANPESDDQHRCPTTPRVHPVNLLPCLVGIPIVLRHPPSRLKQQVTPLRVTPLTLTLPQRWAIVVIPLPWLNLPVLIYPRSLVCRVLPVRPKVPTSTKAPPPEATLLLTVPLNIPELLHILRKLLRSRKVRLTRLLNPQRPLVLLVEVLVRTVLTPRV